MFSIVVFGGLAVVCVVLATLSVKDDEAWPAAFFGALTLAMMGTFAHECVQLGLGNTDPEAERYTKRLQVGVPYEVLAAHQDKENHVLFVKRIGTSSFYTIRVKGEPPKFFTIVDGSPIAIEPPK